MEKKKVLLVSPLPPPAGGIASWTVHILEYFKNNTEHFELLHYNTGRGKRRITEIGKLRRIYYGIIDLKSRIREVYDKVVEEKLNVVHITSSASLGLLRDLMMLRQLKNTTARLIIHFRFGRIPELAIKKNWEWKLLYKVCNLADRVIVIDKRSYQTLINSGLKNVDYLPNPISDWIEKKFKKGFLENKDEGNVLFVGHIIPFKGVFELVHACNQLEIVKKLILVGPFEENMKEQLLTMAEKTNSSDKILFEGSKSHEYVVERMKKCSAFVLPSYTEGFPNVILEAMAASAPIVATDVGAIPEMLQFDADEKLGYCVKPRDIEGLRKSIQTILENPINSNKMGVLAQKNVFSEYSMKVVMNNLICIWNKINY